MVGSNCLPESVLTNSVALLSYTLVHTRKQYGSKRPEDLEPAQHDVTMAQRQEVSEVREHQAGGADDAEAGEEPATTRHYTDTSRTSRIARIARMPHMGDN